MMVTTVKMMMISPSETEKVILLCLFRDSVRGKSHPSAPVNFLNHLTAVNQSIHSISLNNL